MSINQPNYHQALQYANQAHQAGDNHRARYWAAEAARLNPHDEMPWLMLAALAKPRASLEYYKKALEINPQSEFARKGIARILKTMPHPADERALRAKFQLAAPPAVEKRRQPFLAWFSAILLVGVLFLALWFGGSTMRVLAASVNLFHTPTTPVRLAARLHQLTPTPTPTFTPTPTPTPTFTPTPTDTPTPTPTETPTPTMTPIPIPTEPLGGTAGKPSEVGNKEFWIEVDLSQQRLYAYKGENLLDSFLVSTGTWAHPTVTGAFQIYVKFDSQTMSGPGYYLPGVPYVMYFYKDYSIHGTYWHSNFGTPMSHGCVNMYTPNAEWVYGLAKIGTWVIIHN